MKRLFYFVVAATFAATIVTSCGKTSKGKMDGEWTISSSQETSSNVSTSTTNSNTTAISGAVITQTNTSGGNSTTTSGVVNQATWTIKKDGTWERTITATYTNGTYSTKRTEVASGKWDFLKSVSKDYKTNERVVFNVLSTSNTTVNTAGTTTTTSSDSDTYLDGEVSSIFVVTESTKSALTLTLEGANTSSSTSGTTTTTDKYTSSSTYSLTK